MREKGKRVPLPPKPAVCRLADISVRGAEYGKAMSYGAEVDLNELVAPGLTLEQALGEYVAGFELIR